MVKIKSQLLQKTASTSVPSWALVSTRAFGATTLYTALPETMRLSYSVRPLWNCPLRYWPPCVSSLCCCAALLPPSHTSECHLPEHDWREVKKISFRRFAFHCRKIKRKFRGSSVLQTRLKSLSSMDTAVLEEKEVICWQNDNSVRYVEIDRVTTVWPLSTSTSKFVQNCAPELFKIMPTMAEIRVFV